MTDKIDLYDSSKKGTLMMSAKGWAFFKTFSVKKSQRSRAGNNQPTSIHSLNVNVNLLNQFPRTQFKPLKVA